MGKLRRSQLGVQCWPDGDEEESLGRSGSGGGAMSNPHGQLVYLVVEQCLQYMQTSIFFPGKMFKLYVQH